MDRMSKMSSMQTSKLRSYLAKLGVDPAVAKEIVTMSKTRKQISAALTTYIRERGRGVI